MKQVKSLCSILFAVLILFAVQNPVFAAYNQFTMLNSTERTIIAVYFTSSADENWGSNRLSGVWNNGNTLTLNTPVKTYWDLKIIFQTGGEASWAGIDTAKHGYAIIRPNGNGGYTLDLIG